MYVEFTKSPSGEPFKLAYFVGDIADIEDAVAKDLIDQGLAKPAKKPAETAADKGAAASEKTAK